METTKLTGALDNITLQGHKTSMLDLSDVQIHGDVSDNLYGDASWLRGDISGYTGDIDDLNELMDIITGGQQDYINLDDLADYKDDNNNIVYDYIMGLIDNGWSYDLYNLYKIANTETMIFLQRVNLPEILRALKIDLD